MSAPLARVWQGTVSVIVPTHDRPVSLVRLLRALAAASVRRPDEVIVVADGCSPDTARAITAASLPYPLRLIAQEPARGPAVARNTGAREATGDLLLFIDDDIEPFGDIVGAHRALHDGAERVVIGAPRTPISRDAGFRWLAGWAWWEQQFERLRSPGHRFGYDDLFTGVLSIPRSVWAAIGGFDESLHCREDFELGLRLTRQRVAFDFTERGGGWHHENRTGERLVRRKWAEGAADVALARLHPWAFSALRISRGGADRRRDVVRRLAFEWPRTGVVLAWLADRGEHVLERLRMRGAWRQLHAGAMYFAYWRGAAAVLGSWRELDALRDAATGALPPGHRELDVDLAEERTQWLCRVDLVRPDVLRLRYGDLPLGEWGSAPGREPLRSEHLEIPPDEIVSALVIARSAHELRVPASVGPRPLSVERPLAEPGMAEELRDGPTAVVEFDLANPNELPTADSRFDAVRVLIRAGARPVGWLHLPVANGVCSTEELGPGIRGLAPDVARCALRARSSRPPTATPAISIVICTRDRPDSLARCLDSIVALDYPQFEVVLVDNAPSSEATERLARNYPVRYVRENIPGLDWARNRGIAEARHEIIAFTDDDVRVDSQWLGGVAAGFADPAVGLVTGFVAPASLSSDAERLFELAYGGMGKGFAPQVVDGATAQAAQLLSTHHLGVGANMALRRTVLGEIGGFDTALDVGTPSHGGGDLDVFHRVLLTGRRAHYEPSAIVWHYHRDTTAGLRRQMYDNGRAFGTYMLVRLRDRRLPRAIVLRELLRWAAWLTGRVPRRLLRREKMPLPYIAAELWGALHAPYAFLRTYAHDRRLCTQSSSGGRS